MTIAQDIDESIELLKIYKEMTQDNKKILKGILIGMTYRSKETEDNINGR